MPPFSFAFKLSTRLKAGLFYGVALLLMWGWIGYLLQTIGAGIRSDLHLNVLNVAISTKSQIQSLFDTSDEILKTLKVHFERPGHFDRNLLDEYFQGGLLNQNKFHQAGIIDRDGIYIYSNLKNQKKINLADREHFRIHQTAFPYQLFVSQPILGRASNKWSLQMTRKLVTPTGDFNGVAVISIDPKIISSFFDQYKLGDASLIALMDTQGRVKVLRLNGRDYTDGAISEIQLPDDWQHKFSGDGFHELGMDHVKRYYAYERLDNSDLLVLVGAVQDDLTASMRVLQANLLVMAALITLVSVGACLYWARSAKMRRQLASELTDVRNELGNTNLFHDGLLEKLATACREQLAKIEQNANYIEGQSHEEMTQMSAKTIHDHSTMLAQTLDRAVQIKLLQSKQEEVSESQHSVKTVIDALDTFQKKLSPDNVVTYQISHLQALDEWVTVDVQQLCFIVAHIVNYALLSNCIAPELTVDVELKDASPTSRSLSFGFEAPLDRFSDDFLSLMKNKGSIFDIELSDKFDVLKGIFHLYKIQGHLSLTEIGSNLGRVCIQLPVK